MSTAPQIKTALLENLKELHLPTMRACPTIVMAQSSSAMPKCRDGINDRGMSLCIVVSTS